MTASAALLALFAAAIGAAAGWLARGRSSITLTFSLGNVPAGPDGSPGDAPPQLVSAVGYMPAPSGAGVYDDDESEAQRWAFARRTS